MYLIDDWEDYLYIYSYTNIEEFEKLSYVIIKKITIDIKNC